VLGVRLGHIGPHSLPVDALVSYRDNARDNIQCVQAVQTGLLRGKHRPHRTICSIWASAHRIEGLVRDNRVEVRVLFGAYEKEPAQAGFFFPRRDPDRPAAG
jgi:hypothetical protein